MEDTTILSLLSKESPYNCHRNPEKSVIRLHDGSRIELDYANHEWNRPAETGEGVACSHCLVDYAKYVQASRTLAMDVVSSAIDIGCLDIVGRLVLDLIDQANVPCPTQEKIEALLDLDEV